MKFTIKDWFDTEEEHLCVGTYKKLVALFNVGHIVDDYRDIDGENNVNKAYPSGTKVKLEGWHLCLTKKEFSKIFKAIGVK